LSIYQAGALITGIIAFLLCWLYAVITYGLFIGVGLGWIPSLVIAFIAGLLWPLVAVVVAVLAIVVFNSVSH